MIWWKLKFVKFYVFLYVFWGVAAFFETLCDAINFHPYSWVVQLWPSFMQITDTETWFMPLDGWHISKFFMVACYFLCIYCANKIGYYFLDIKAYYKFFVKNAVILGVINYGIHELFLHVVFK